MPRTRRRFRRFSGRRRRSFWRGGPAWVQSQTVTSMTCIAGQVATAKEYKLNVILPDVQSGRPVLIKKITTDWAICGVPSAAGTSATIQMRMVGEPWTEAGNIISGGTFPYGNSTPAITLPFGKNVRLTMKPSAPGNMNYVVSDSTSTCFILWMSSLLATSAQVTITIHYVYARDPIISAVT